MMCSIDFVILLPFLEFVQQIGPKDKACQNFLLVLLNVLLELPMKKIMRQHFRIVPLQ